MHLLRFVCSMGRSGDKRVLFADKVQKINRKHDSQERVLLLSDGGTRSYAAACGGAALIENASLLSLLCGKVCTTWVRAV